MLTRILRALALAGVLAALPLAAFGQSFPSGYLQANTGASAGPPKASSATSWLDRWCGSTNEMILRRSGGTWGCTTLGTGVATWLATPSSANLRAAISDETGTGLAYFQGGDIGTPSAGVATNLTGLPTTGLVDDAVTDAKLRESAGLSVIGRAANSTGNPADIAAGSDHQVLRRSGTALGFGSIDLSQSAAVGSSVLAAGNGGTGLAALASGIATFLGTPSSANLRAALTDETGSGGSAVFATGPTISAPVFTGLEDHQGAIKLSTQSAPAQITGNQDNYNPSSVICVSTETLLVNADAARDITGLAGGVAGCRLTLVNNGGFTITLKNLSGSSSAGNQFSAGGDVALDANKTVWLTYDGAASKWRVYSPPLAGAGSGTVTSVTAGAGLSGGTITTSGTLALDPTYVRGHIAGLRLSNNGSDATNDIDIAVGVATADDSSAVIKLTSGLTKRLDAAWAVGTNNGGLDTGAIANTTYHIFLIRRSDTGVVDALFSASGSSPTMPANYDQKRRVGSIIRASGAILAFTQTGDTFTLSTNVNNVNGSATSASAASVALTVPTGGFVDGIFVLRVDHVSTATAVLITSLAQTDQAPSTQITTVAVSSTATTATTTLRVPTDSSGQVRVRSSGTGAAYYITTSGWVDRRGRDD